MKKLINSSNGFIPLIGLVIILVVAIIAAGSIYYVARPEQSTNTNVAVINANNGSISNQNVNGNVNSNVNRNANTNQNVNSGVSLNANTNINSNTNLNTNTNSPINTNTDSNTNLNTNTGSTVPTNWKTYANTMYGYSIQYPPTWTIYNETGENTVQIIPAGYSGGTMQARARAIILSNVAVINTNDIITNGPNSIIVNGITATRQTEAGEVNTVATYVPKTNSLYIETAWPEAYQNIYLEYAQILATFQFTE